MSSMLTECYWCEFSIVKATESAPIEGAWRVYVGSLLILIVFSIKLF